jgi:hypothetical protein
MYNIKRNNSFIKNILVKSFSEVSGIKNVGVVGSGQMGSGIAYVFGR